MWGLRPGVYRHYKGGLYRALFLAPVWVEGRAVPRFQWVGEEPFHPGV